MPDAARAGGSALRRDPGLHSALYGVGHKQSSFVSELESITAGRRFVEGKLVKDERDESFLGTTKHEQVRKADCQK